MKTYVVDFMNGTKVVSSQTIDASTPFIAASKAARGSIVHYKVDKTDWIRVTLSGQSRLEFGYDKVPQ